MQKVRPELLSFSPHEDTTRRREPSSALSACFAARKALLSLNLNAVNVKLRHNNIETRCKTQTPGLGVCMRRLSNRATHSVTESGEAIGTAKGASKHFSTSFLNFFGEKY